MVDEDRLRALEDLVPEVDKILDLLAIGTVQSLQEAAVHAENLKPLSPPIEEDDEESDESGVKRTKMEKKPPWSEGGVSVREPRRPNSMDESVGVPSARPGHIPNPTAGGSYRIPFSRYGPSKAGALRRPSLATRDHPGIGTTIKSLIAKYVNTPPLAERVLVKADVLQGPPPPEGSWSHCLRCGSLIIQTGDELGWRHVTLTTASHVGVPSLPGRVPHAAPEPQLGAPGVTVNVVTAPPESTDSIPLAGGPAIEEKFRGRSRATYRKNPQIERFLRENPPKALQQPQGPIVNPNAVTPPDRGVAAQGPPPQPGSTGICERCGGILVLNQRGRWAHVIELPTSHVGLPRIDSIGRAVKIPK